MIVQHNITSMNANRQLGIVGNNLAKSTEKLSSDTESTVQRMMQQVLLFLRKMRAPGSRQIVHLTTHRMVFLLSRQLRCYGSAACYFAENSWFLVRANSGVLDGTAERLQKIQDEIDTLKSECERMLTDTEFNRKKLLDGSYKDQYLQLRVTKQCSGIDVTIQDNCLGSNLYLSKTTEVAKNTVGTASDKNAGTNGTVVEGTTQYEYNSKIFTVEES